MRQFPSSIDSNQQTITELEERLLEQSEKFSNLSRVGAMIASILELERILPAVMESALDMVRGEAGFITLFDTPHPGSGQVSWGLSEKVLDSIQNGGGESLRDYLKRTSQCLKIDSQIGKGGWILGESQAHINNLMAIPLKTQDRMVGAMVVANKVGARHFDDEDLFALETLGSFAAVAIENSELHEQALARQKIEAELEMARYVQKTLMPRKTADTGRISIVAHNYMATQVGGDFHDIIELSPKRIFLVVADVSSKGLPAALLMSSTRSLIRAYVDEPIDIGRIIENVNGQLYKDSYELRGMFVTLIIVYLDFNEGIIRSVNAGHPPAFLHYLDGRIVQLKSGGPFLGQFNGLEYSEERHPLESGARLFLYTDGAFECSDSRGKMLGLASLRDFFAANCHLPAGEFVENLHRILDSYSYDQSNIDDTTFLLADVKGS
jgi:sigma-B regulation protein RsbU (phosphoserine phosphatase)